MAYNCKGKPLLHGGRRINAGRKRLYTEETKTISFRVPKSLIEPITKYVKRALAKELNSIWRSRSSHL